MTLKRVLVVHPYGIGDFLFVTPVLRALRLIPSVEKVDLRRTEFAKQAYETFVMDAQKIRELYSGLAKQTFEGAVAQVVPAAR